MDKIEQLYKLYLEQGLITSATSLENFSGASDEQRTELYKLGGTKNLFSTTDLDTFKSAWTKEPVKTEAVAAETVPVTAQKKAVDTGLKSVNGSLEPEKKTDPDKPFDERYLDFASGYDKSKGKSRLYEDVYLKDWAGKPTGKGGFYPSNFEDYAKSFGTTLKQETSESLDGFEIKAVKSKEFKKKEENANKLRNKISKINPLNSKGSIGFEYLGFEDKGGYIAPKLEEKERPYDYVKNYADGQKEVYKYGIPGPFDGYSKEYKNTYNQDLKNKLGESRYKQVEKAINGAAAKNIDLTKENLGEFIDLSLIPQNVQSKIVDNLQSNAADAFVQTLEEKERMDITSFLGTDSFKEAVRLDKELKQKDAEDYKRQYGKALVSEKTVMDLDTRQTRTFTPINTSFLNITGKSDLSEFKKLAENVYVKDQEDISNIVKNFDSTYEDYNKKVSTYQVRSKKVKDKYNKAKDVLSKNQTQENVDAVNAVVEEYKSMVNEDDFNSLNTTFESMTAMKLDLENRSKISLQDSEKLKLLGVQTSSLAKNYSNLDRLALQMEDFFIANPLLLVSDVGEWIGAGIQAVTPLNTSTVNTALKSGGTATMAYKNRLAEKIQNLPYTAKSGEDDYEIGNYLASTLADNGPSLLVTAATMLATGGIGGAASLSTMAKAAKLSGAVFFATEYGGSLYDTKNARTEAQKTIINLKDSLPFITDQGEIKYTESLIDGLKNTANVSDFQSTLMAASAATVASFMETYGTLGTVDFMRKYSKVVGPESFKALLNPALKRYASIGTKAAIGAGTSVLGNNMEETLTALGQNFAKALVLKEDIDITEGIDTEFFKTNTLIGFAASGPTLSQNVTSMLNAEFNTSASVKKQKEASKELLSIQARIEEIKSSEAKPDSDIVSVISKAKQKQEIAKLEIEKTKKIEEISLMHSNVLLDVSQLSVDELNAVIDDNRVLRSLLNEAQELSSELEPGDSFTKNRLKKLESKYLEVLSSKENILNRPVKEIKEQFKKALNPVEAAYNKGLYLNINSIVKNIKGINTYEFGGEFGITALNRYIEDNNIGEADAKALIEGYKSGNNAANIGKDILLFTDNVDNALMQQSGARAKVAAVSAFHEVGHIQARQAGIVKDGKVVGDANAMMDGIFADIKYRKDIGEISQKDYDFFLERIGQYTNELDSKGNVIFNETKGVNVDELIQLVGDLTNSGVLKKSSYAKVFEIKNFINSFYKNKNGDASKFFKLDQPSDVFDFVASWTTKAKKGDIKFDSSDEEEKLVSSKSIADLNTELEELIDNEYEMDEGDFESQKSNLEFKIKQAKAVAETSKKPTVKKEGSTKEKAVSSKVYNNESLVETIKSKDSTTREKAKAEADLVDSFDSLALKAIKYDTRKGDYDREDVRDYLREFLPGIIERYDPSESKFSTYVTNTMAPKAQQTYEKFRKIADKSIDAEIGGVGSVKEMSGDINTLYGSDAESSGLKESTQKMIKATSFGPISDPAILEAVENVIEVKESERPNFKSLNNKYFDKVSEAIFGINGKKTRGNASLKYDKSGGSSEANSLQNVFKNDNDVKKFIKTMPDYNIATKETVVNEQGEIIDVSRDTYGRSIGINPKVLAIFYDKVQGAIPGVSSPNGRSLGLTTQTDVYKLKPEFTGNISPASVAKLQSLIGINKGTLSIPIKGEARTEFGSILTGLTKMYIDNVINTVGRSKLDTNQAKADLGAGKSSLMFSKSTLEGKYLTVNQKTTLINTVNSLKSKNTDNDLTNDVWSNIILNIDKSKNLYEVFNSISEVVEVVLTVKGQRTFEQNLLNSLLRSAKIDFKSVILDSFNEYRKIFKYEYRTIGFDFVKSKLKSDISEADSEESKKQVIKNFILFESRSIRTGKIDGIRTNEVLFDKILKELGAEDLGFEVLKKDGRSYITLDKVVLTGMLDITKVKEGFTPKTIALMNSEASSALNHVIKVLKGSALNTAKGYLSLISLDQRGILRKISTPGFEITGFKPNRLILEHETTALSLYKKLIDFVEGNISEKELRDFVSKSKVNLIPETLDNLLNGKNVTAIDKARYSTKEFLDVLNKYKEKGRYKEATSSDIKALKETAVYKKFNKTLDGKKLYHGGSGIIKSPNVNSEDHLTWFYVDVAEAAMDWVEGKTTTSTQQYLYEVDFNSIAEDHVVFPDFELIPYTIIKEAVDKVYPKGGYLPEANNIKNPYGAIEIMKDPKAGKILEEFLKWSLNNNAAYEYYTGDPLIEKGKISEGQAIIVLGEISRDKSKKMSFSKSLNLDKEFNDIIENKTGIASYKEFAAVKAALRGQKKGRFDFFIPPSAEDFVGLLYYTLGKGTVGDSQMKWYKDNLLNPYARAVENITRDRNNLGRDFLALKKDLKIIPKNLKKKTKGGDFTREQAIRVYIWNEIGKDVPGLSKLDLVELVDIVNSDPQLKLFAQEIMKLNKGRAYVSPADGWVTGTITTDLLESLNTTGRKQYLELWKQNVDIIFSEKNLNKLEAAYGKSYRYALENMLHRMETGRNRTYGMDSTTGRFTDWINGSTAAIMFFNTRSALLQTISAVNFINFGDNNVIAAGKAFANQKQYWSDFKLLFNSEFLTERRDGLKININEADIADIAKEKGVRGVINKLLKLGFLPTQIADSFAIASGGSTFYRNRVKSLVKGGMNTEAAEKQAMRDFREIAEESQQSSRPDKISSQQAGPLGRIILAFANTPAQYARIIKKSASDLKNGRGDAKTNLAKILYYGVAQNILFNTLQQAMFAMLFEGDEEDDSILAEKKVKVINGMVDSIARGTGLYGAVFTVVKNASVRIYEQTQKKNPDYRNTYLELLKISPPISSKIQKFASAEKTASWNMKEIKSKGFSLDNPGFLAAGKVISSTTNIPLDRAIRKLNNLKAASDSQVETYKRIALLAGWSEWELGMKKKKEVKSKSTKKSTKVKYWTKSPY
jgi:hypothetical protein